MIQGIWNQTICWLTARGASSLVTSALPSKYFAFLTQLLNNLLKVLWISKQSNDPCGSNPLVQKSWTSLWCQELWGRQYITALPLASSFLIVSWLPGWCRYMGSGVHPGRTAAASSFSGRGLWPWSTVKDFPGFPFAFIYVAHLLSGSGHPHWR